MLDAMFVEGKSTSAFKPTNTDNGDSKMPRLVISFSFSLFPFYILILFYFSEGDGLRREGGPLSGKIV